MGDGVVLAVDDSCAGVDGAAVAGGMVFSDFLVAGGYAAAVTSDFDFVKAFWSYVSVLLSLVVLCRVTYPRLCPQTKTPPSHSS